MSKEECVKLYFSRPKEVNNSTLSMNLVLQSGRVGNVALTINVTMINEELVAELRLVLDKIKTALTRPVIRPYLPELNDKS